jgi:hypothetical protein
MALDAGLYIAGALRYQVSAVLLQSRPGIPGDCPVPSVSDAHAPQKAQMITLASILFANGTHGIHYQGATSSSQTLYRRELVKSGSFPI